MNLVLKSQVEALCDEQELIHAVSINSYTDDVKTWHLRSGYQRLCMKTSIELSSPEPKQDVQCNIYQAHCGPQSLLILFEYSAPCLERPLRPAATCLLRPQNRCTDTILIKFTFTKQPRL